MCASSLFNRWRVEKNGAAALFQPALYIMYGYEKKKKTKGNLKCTFENAFPATAHV